MTDPMPLWRVNRWQCIAPKKDGERCKTLVKYPKVLCHTHKDMYSGPECTA